MMQSVLETLTQSFETFAFPHRKMMEVRNEKWDGMIVQLVWRLPGISPNRV